MEWGKGMNQKHAFVQTPESQKSYYYIPVMFDVLKPVLLSTLSFAHLAIA